MTRFNVARINTCTENEGPGKRIAIWFQGCLQRCPGCCNPDMIRISPNHIISLESMLEIIRESKEKFGISGVTYIGGEPTLQKGLPMLSKEIAALGLGIIAFTGYRYEDVEGALLYCDLVIDGPYLSAHSSTFRRIIGSDNQRMIFLSDRYKESADWFTKSITKNGDFNVCTSGIYFNGDKI